MTTARASLSRLLRRHGPTYEKALIAVERERGNACDLFSPQQCWNFRKAAG